MSNFSFNGMTAAMSSNFVQVASGVGRKALTATALSIIGLVVGFSCVLLPPAIPFVIIGIAAVLLLWVMPELRRVPDRWVRAMVPVVVLVFTSVPSYFAIILPGLPWISIHDVVLLLWLGPLLIVLAGSPKARQQVSIVLHASPWLSCSTLGFMAISLLTLPTAAYFFTSFHFVTNSFLNWFIPMFGVIVCVRDDRAISTLFRIAIFAVGVNFVLGLVEFYLQHPFLIYLLPSSMRDQIAAQNPIAAASMYTGWGIRRGLYRASGTFTTSLTWGEICAMTIPFSLHFVAHGKTILDKLFGAAGSFMCFLSVVLSGARGAYVAMIAAAACYSIVWACRSSIINRQSLAGKIGLTFYSMACGAVLLAVLFVPAVHNRVLGGGQEQLSSDSRAVQWALAEPKILARPVLGYGGGSAGEVIHYISGLHGYSVDGYYMNLLVDYGLLGFLLFFLSFIIAAVNSLWIYISSNSMSTTMGNALGSSILAFIVYRTTLSQTDSLVLAFVILGLSIVYSYWDYRATAIMNPTGDRHSKLYEPIHSALIGQ